MNLILSKVKCPTLKVGLSIYLAVGRWNRSLTFKGNWSLHTTDFAKSKLWGYFNLLDLQDVEDVERQLLQLAIEDGPYDGILGYSQGATLAAQTIIRHNLEHPEAAIQDMPFRFAIFFNGATPSKVFEMSETPIPVSVESVANEPEAIHFLSQMKANPLLHTTKLFPAKLPNGRPILTDSKQGMLKCNAALDGTLIKIPTLHVRCPGDREEYGHELYKLCEPQLAQQYFHDHEHDFPRGYDEMRNIARLIRSTAELSI
jgi:hypothetical protein